MTSFFRDNSTQVGGVSSIIYTGTNPDSSKYFYGNFYNENGTYVSFNLINTITYYMGLGNDTLTIDGSGMAQAGNALTLDGGGGTDTLNANFGVVTTAFTITNTSISTANISAANFEVYNLTLGSGADTVTLTGGAGDYINLADGNDGLTLGNATGYQSFNGGSGLNRLTVNNGTQVNGVASTIYTSGSGQNTYFYGNFYNDTSRTEYTNMDKLYYTMGSGNDSLYLDGNGLTQSAATIAVEAGAGGDLLDADLRVLTTDIVLTDTSLTTNRVALTGFERYDLDFGSGNDTVTRTGALNDALRMGAGNDSVTINGAVGYQTVNGGSGFNSLSVDNSAQTVGVGSNIYSAGSGAGAYFYGNFYNDTIRTDYDFMGQLTYAMGSGANHLYLDGNSLANVATSVSVSSGASYDTLDADLHVLGTDMVLSDHSLTTARVSLTGFDQYDLDFGSGNDTVTRTGAANDLLRMAGGNDSVAITGAAAYQAVDGGDGFDTLSVDNSAQSDGVSSNIYSSSGYFYGNLYNDDSRTDFDHIETVTYESGSGNDSLYVDGNSLAVAGRLVSVDAGAGFDYLNANLAVITTDITLNGATLGTDSVTLNGFERYNVTFGSGNDSVTVGHATDYALRLADGNDTVSLTDALGYQTIDGGNGLDSLSIDNGGQTNAVSNNIYSASGYFYGNVYNTTSRTDFDHTEQLAVIMGDGDDAVSVDASSLSNASATLSIDGAGGNDSLSANLSVITTNITLTATGLTTTRLSLGHFENFNVTFGSGNDNVTRTGATNDALRMANGNDTVKITSAVGYQAVDGGNGTDTLILNNAALVNGVTNNIYSSGGYFYGNIYNDSSRTDFDRVEVLNYAAGNGNDTVNVDGTSLGSASAKLLLNGGGGTDILNLNLSSAGALSLKYLTGGALEIGNSRFSFFETINLTFGNYAYSIQLTTGNDTYNGSNADDTIDGGPGNDVLNGAGGRDTASYVSAAAAVTVSLALQGGPQATGGGGTDTLTNFENLTGSDFNDSLTGDNNNNALTGGLGNDTLTGGLGDDSYYIDAGDSLIEGAGAGTDTVYAGFTSVLSSNFENLVLTGAGNIDGTGTAGNNRLTGNSGSNALNGGSGDDWIDGGAGADNMTGGAGRDTYIVDNAGDTITELASQGTDLVQTSVSYGLAVNVENLTLTGAANINGSGNAGNNILTGNAGNNVLNGLGGADTLIGGAGNDTYYVDIASDVVTEAVGEGTDTVVAAVNWTLGANFENLTLAAGAANLNGAGNDLNNVITGNAGANTLNGGLGIDSLAGGDGNDTYVVDTTTDVITETSTGGTDAINASLSYTLAAGLYVEVLNLTGAGNIDATGNAFNNTINGNAGNNTLNGAAGADIMTGGLGDDIFYVDNTGDKTIEAVGGGNDTVRALASYSGTGQYIETIILMGSAAINATGQGLDNQIFGNAGVNTLDGGSGNDILNGGKGADILIGGVGSDRFAFVAGSGLDTINDFHASQNDLIDINGYTHGVVNGGGVTISQVGADAVIDLGGGNVITVLATSATASAFLNHIVW